MFVSWAGSAGVRCSDADGGGISLKGATDKLFRWLNATDSWTSSEHLDLASGKAYYINGTGKYPLGGQGMSLSIAFEMTGFYIMRLMINALGLFIETIVKIRLI